MANKASAEKRVRQNVKRRGINRAKRSALRTQIKKARQVVEEGGQVATVLHETQVELDKAAAKNLIHKNKAARLKSRLARAAAAQASAS